ncbi:hypothetical protein IMZ31_24335 (plasmid) [Pontibacillus sp. ALD_SL1]|uniref:hypothetical protein n=1 Tax=Pontibacillus sp. ALD_SL1 TaxID=2777185 RepID=UPI001A972294|nr:hypothetical protein [Pontibacillus sp. ALD_SL1]QST02582.1 hypothetical protein IMZ31_24335 [Pontibacillus sp. ALD_SL1]
MKITLQDVFQYKVSNEANLFDLMKNWDEKVKPYLRDKEIVEALINGFDDHFPTQESLEDYDWENPRLDHFGAIGFVELHEIMDEETFREYIGGDYEAYFHCEEENEDCKDWVKDHSYFAYRALGRCHHLSPFLKEIGRKMMPEYEWHILELPAHSNAVGIKDGEVHVVVDLLWGERHNNAYLLLEEMFDLSKTILLNQLGSDDDEMTELVKMSVDVAEKELLNKDTA